MSDRIALQVTAPVVVVEALERHRDLVTAETLAVSVDVTTDDGAAEPTIEVAAVT